MSLPAYAMNQTSFPEMYERWLVGPLFRPWAETLIERLAWNRAIASWTSPAAPASWPAWRESVSATPGT